MPFKNMYLKCDQHYYITSLKNNELPKVKAFSDWIKARANSEIGHQ